MVTICSECGKEFMRQSKSPFCSGDCRRENKRQYLKTYYRDNRAEYRVRKKAGMVRNRAIILEAKAQPCTDCGNTYPSYVMDFDHIAEKRFTISRKGKKTSKGALLAEIGRCELVCANCHRIRTHQRKEARKLA